MKVLLIVLLLVVLIVSYHAYVFGKKVAVSRDLVERAVPYMLEGPRTTSLLILGDSTAVGVGADRPEDSVAALIAREIGATYVENHALSGARVNDLTEQVRAIKHDEYDYIVISIGGNDIIRFRGADDAAAELGKILTELPKHNHLILHSAGNVGATTLFPWFLNPYYTRSNLAYHAALERVVTEAGGTYVNFYSDPATDPFAQQPEIYLSADGLHPSSAGYKVWFEKIRPHL